MSRLYHEALGDHHHHRTDGSRLDHSDASIPDHNVGHAIEVELIDEPCDCEEAPQFATRKAQR